MTTRSLSPLLNLFVIWVMALGCRGSEPSPVQTQPAPALDPALVCTQANKQASCFQRVDATGSPDSVPHTELWVLKSEVTAANYDQCIQQNGCSTEQVMTAGGMATVGQPQKRRQPATGVTYQGARDYCAWRGARLPTEAEWDWIARGSSERLYPWGDKPRCPLYLPKQDAILEADISPACGKLMTRLKSTMTSHETHEISEQLKTHLTADELHALCEDNDDASVEETMVAIQAAISFTHIPESCQYRNGWIIHEGRYVS